MYIKSKDYVVKHNKDVIPRCCRPQWLPGAVSEGRAAEVLQRAALRVLVPVRQVPGRPHLPDGGGGRALLLRDPDADLGLAHAAHPVHHTRTLPGITFLTSKTVQ